MITKGEKNGNLFVMKNIRYVKKDSKYGKSNTFLKLQSLFCMIICESMKFLVTAYFLLNHIVTQVKKSAPSTIQLFVIHRLGD